MVAATLAAISGALASAPSAVAAYAGPMKAQGSATAPIGFEAFCRASPADCVASGQTAAPSLTRHRWRDLVEINASVNRSIEPATDLELYGREEHWTLPARRGDCEDYVLLKRKLLIERGWPTGALLIAVLFDEYGEGHAVLVARTTHGEYVLDNKVAEIRLWHQTLYRFVKRQSVRDPRSWVYIGDPRWSTAVTAAP